MVNSGIFSPPISILILTRDEEINIAGCLDSVADYDDGYVLDSSSRDQPLAIVRERGIPVYHHPFDRTIRPQLVNEMNAERT